MGFHHRSTWDIRLVYERDNISFKPYCEKKRKPLDMALRPSHTRQLSYANYYSLILKPLQHKLNLKIE